MMLYGTPGFRRQLSVDLDYQEDVGKQWKARYDANNEVVDYHENHSKWYSKYHPNETKYHVDVDTGEKFVVGINSTGFRGKEFSKEKREGVIRVVTLGASSTFGFYNRDHQTYPYQLEQMLNEKCDQHTYEVINLAIPHSKSDNIAAIFALEALPLKPDIVTFYEGRNETIIDARSTHDIAMVRPWDGRLNESVKTDQPSVTSQIGDYLMSVRFVLFLLEQRAQDDDQYTIAEIDKISRARSAHFLGNVRYIAEECHKRGILFLPTTQQGTSMSWFGSTPEQRQRIKGVTLQDEVDGIRARLEWGDAINYFEACLLVHQHLK